MLLLLPLVLATQTSEKGKATLAMIQSRGSSNGTLSAAVAATAAAAEDGEARDWADMYEDYLDAELEEDEEIESYYFSSAAGRARVVLGNRRWGEGGFMRAGKQSCKQSDMQPRACALTMIITVRLTAFSKGSAKESQQSEYLKNMHSCQL